MYDNVKLCSLLLNIHVDKLDSAIQMQSIEERVSHLEGSHQHLATKSDLAELKADIKTDIAQMESRLLRWMVGMMLTSTAVAVSIATLIQNVID